MENSLSTSPQSSDQEIEIDLRQYWRIISRYKWGILGLAFAITVLAMLITFSIQPIFRGTTTLLIEQKQAKVVTIQEVYDMDGGNKEYLQTQFEILKSRELATRVVKQLNLKDHADFAKKEESGVSIDWRSWLPAGHVDNPLPTDDQEQARIVDLFMAKLFIEPVRNTQLVNISFESPDPRLAAQVSNAMAKAYIDSQMEAKIAMTEQAASWLTDRLGSLKLALEQSEQKLQAYREKNDLVGSSSNQVGSSTGNNGGVLALNAQQLQDITERVIAAQFKLSEISQRYGPKHPTYQQAELDVAEAQQALQVARQNALQVTRKEFGLQELMREVETNRNLYDTFFKRIKEANETRQLETPNARVIDPAVVPTLPVKPKKSLIVALAFVLSLMLGVMLAFLLDYLDSTFKGPEDVEARLGVPMLGMLPIARVAKQAGTTPLFLQSDQQGFAEAVRTVRTGVVLSGLDTAHQIIVVTSSVPSEGKTTSSISLALAMAQMEKILLIDADMRRPTVAKVLGIPGSSPGLSNLVAGSAELAQCIHHHKEGNIDILPAGLIPPNPLELLSSRKFKEVLGQLAEQYDRVVIDSAPTLAVSDALMLSTLATSVIYVVKSDSTSFHNARTGIQRLQRVNAPLTGVVLNQVNLTKANRYGGYYGYYDYYGYKTKENT